VHNSKYQNQKEKEESPRPGTLFLVPVTEVEKKPDDPVI
jgi:hypothetical protein